MASNVNPNAGRAADRQFILDRAQNITNSAEGSVLPPRQVGSTRVPIVTNLRVLTAEPFVGGTQFRLGFNEPYSPNNPIANYNLYYSVNGSADRVNAGTCRKSPAIFSVSGPSSQKIAFIVQTVMQNGFTSEINLSPSCTATSPAASVTPADLTGLDIVFGGTQMAPAGLVPYTAATATYLTTDPNLQFDDSTKNFGNTAGSPVAGFTTDRDVAFGIDPTVHTADFTLANYWLTPVDTSGGDVDVTLPSAAGLPGYWVIVKKVTNDTNDLTLIADGTDTIDGAASLTVSAAYGLISVARVSSTAWAVL